MADGNQNSRKETASLDDYVFSEKFMLAAIAVLAATVVFVVGRYICDRWFFMRLRRRRQRELSHMGEPRFYNVFHTNVHHVIDRGLERAVLSSLPVFLYSGRADMPHAPPQDCTVCLSEFEENDIVRLLPKCNHSFHIDCIDMWLHSHSTCPLCRSWVERVSKPIGPRLVGRGSSSSRGETGEGADTTAWEGRKRLESQVMRAEEAATLPLPRRVELEELSIRSPASQGQRFPGSGVLALKRMLSATMKAAAGDGDVISRSGRSDEDLERGQVALEGQESV